MEQRSPHLHTLVMINEVLEKYLSTLGIKL